MQLNDWHVVVAKCRDHEDNNGASSHCKFHGCDDHGISSWHQHGGHHCHPVTGRRTDVCISCQQRSHCCHPCCYTGMALQFCVFSTTKAFQLFFRYIRRPKLSEFNIIDCLFQGLGCAYQLVHGSSRCPSCRHQ